MAPKLVEEFVRAFHKQINLQRRDNDVLREGEKRELTDVVRKLNGLIDAIADGLRAPCLQQRLDDLEARRRHLEQDLSSSPTTPVRLHPTWPKSIVSRLSVSKTPSTNQKFGMKLSRSSAG
jgi:hypothetical protein